MSRSCQSATFSSPTSAAPRTTRARPQIRRTRPGSACAASPTSPSGRGRTAPRPRAPRCGRGGGARARTSPATRRAARARSAPPRAGRAGGSGSSWSRLEPEPLAGDALDLGIRSRVRADRAGQLADAHSFERARDASTLPFERECPAGKLEPERRRLGMDAVRPADRQRLAMLLGAGATASRARSIPASTSPPASRICSASAVSTTSDDVSP